MAKLNRKKIKYYVQSMTGSSFVSSNFDNYSISVSLKSLNHKSLKLILNTSESIPEYTLNFDKSLRKYFNRGIVNCNVDIEEQNPIETFLDEKLFNVCYKKLINLKKKYKVDDEIEMETVLDFYYRISKPDKLKKFDLKFKDMLNNIFKKAVNKLLESRKNEGKKMAYELRRLLNELKINAAHLEELWEKIPDEYTKQLINKTEKLLKGFSHKEISKEDVIKEIAFYIERNDINEEIKRLQAHTKELQKVIEQGGIIGRRTEFILQEMSREITTLSNKVQNYVISKNAVNIKLLIDQMKEIVQNVE